jgi:hypothetical protein
MKLTALLFLSLPVLSLSQNVDSIKFFYLPWKFHIEGEIDEKLVRSYPNHSDSVVIKEQSKISSFIMAVSLINFRPQTKMDKKFIPKMVIDIYLNDRINGAFIPPVKKTIYLDSRQNTLFLDNLYFKNFALENWLSLFVFKNP